MYQWYVMFKNLQADKPTRAESISAALERPVQEAVQEAFGLHQAIGGDKQNPTLEDYFKVVEDAMPPRPVCPVTEWLKEYKRLANKPSLLYPYYKWEGMKQISFQEALSSYVLGFYPVYLLYQDGTEALAESVRDIVHHDGGFGYEKGVPFFSFDDNDEYAFMRAVQRAQGL